MCTFGGVVGATRAVATLHTQNVQQIPKMASTSTSSTSSTPKRVFVTVGSTRFDKLVSAASSDSFVSLLDALTYTHLTIQHGQSPRPALSESSNMTRITVDTYQYKPTLHEDMKQADLIISHAGKALFLSRVLQRAYSQSLKQYRLSIQDLDPSWKHSGCTNRSLCSSTRI